MTALLPWWCRWALLAVLMASSAAFGWIKGNEHGTQKLLDYVGKQAAEEVRIAKGRTVVNERVLTHYIKVAGETQTVTQIVEKEVVKYAESNPGYCLDPRWRVLHDAAATSTVPGPASSADAALGAPTAADALDAVTENYQACNRTADRLDALQDWIRQQQAVK